MSKRITPKSPDYIFSADVIRTIAIIMVVIIHTANSVFERPDFFGGISWWFAITLNAVSRICIPLFIMLSGFFILKKQSKFTNILAKTFWRIIVPLVFWTTIIYISGNILNFYDVLHFPYYLRFFNGNTFYFYFLVIMAGLYLVSPLFKNYLKYADVKSQKLMAWGFVAVGIAETIFEYSAKNCSNENSFTKWVPFAGLFVIGYLIASQKLKFPGKKLLLWTYVAGLTGTLALDYLYYSQGSIFVLRNNPTDCLTHYSDYYLSWNVVLMTIPAFVFLFNQKYGFLIKSFWNKMIYNISRASFGIYLIHLLMVTLLDKGIGWDVDHAGIPLWSYVIARFGFVFATSYFLTTLIHKLPIARKLIGED